METKHGGHVTDHDYMWCCNVSGMALKHGMDVEDGVLTMQ